MTNHLILGTAGHIDHGKTALIRALTGTDTDRLPEEKRRGITIELGFARLDLDGVRLGIVDVPGHERFVRHMLAGATGIDLALLVVAADDSVMPQTREHLEILRLLNLHSGLIAITKCDLVQTDWIDLVEAEIRELVQGTFLESAPIVRTSAFTGSGIRRLHETIQRVVISHADWMQKKEPQLSQSPVPPPFRMAVDRSFTLAGYGTIVTGSVLAGSACVGDLLTVEPGGVAVRVRGLQNHDESTDQVLRGQRAAMNLVGVHHGAIRRGQELATDGYLRPSRLLTVRIDLLPSARRPLKNRSRVQLHLGTNEVTATVLLLPSIDSSPNLAPGASSLAQLHLASPVVSTWRQPFVIRWPSPVETIGGGIILQPCAERIRIRDTESIAMAGQLVSDDVEKRVAAAFYFFGWEPSDTLDILRTTGIDHPDPVIESLRNQGLLVELVNPRGAKQTVHIQVLNTLGVRIARALTVLHQAEPLRRSFDPGQILHAMHASAAIERLWPAIVEHLIFANVITSDPLSGRFALPGQGPQLTRGEQQLFDTIVEQIRSAGVKSPSTNELAAAAPKNRAAVPKLLALAETDGLLIQVEKGLYLHAETM
ncbi:MAG: selenocysteine-specific translation elongation factor, partial [Pirellulales bacterium]|nr:selenocysteine-specific translation elongation factor [Pirellulales bacterium]